MLDFLLILVIIICLVWGCIAVPLFSDSEEGASIALSASMLVVLICLIVIFVNTHETIDRYKSEALIAKADSGYAVYVDGRPVDVNNIDISSYVYISVDDESHKIIITTRG